MPVTYMVNDLSKPQAKGPTLDGNEINLYAIGDRNRQKILFLGSHEMNDAPTYDTVDGATETENGLDPVTGRHVQTSRRLGPSTIRSIAQNIVPPSKLRPRIQNIRRLQDNDIKFNYVLMPHNQCEAKDAYAYILRDGILDDWQLTTGVSGWADNGVPWGKQYVLNTTGQFLEYLGMEFTEIAAAGEPVYGIARIADACNTAVGNGLPNQTVAIGGGATGTPYTGVAQTTDDQFASNTAIDVSAIIAANLLITDMLYIGGNYIFTLADDVGTAATGGGFAYSAGGAAAVLVTGLVVDGMQVLVQAGTDVYALGNGGEIWKSSNKGVSWEQVTSGITADILCAAWDGDNDTMYIGGATANVWSWDLTTFTDLAAAGNITPTAATSITACAVIAPNHVAFGGADGKFYESFRADTDNFVVNNTFGSGIGAIAGDGLGLRVIVGVGAGLYKRDVISLMDFEAITETLTGNVTAIVPGDHSGDEGTNFYWIATDTGEVAKLASYFADEVL